MKIFLIILACLIIFTLGLARGVQLGVKLVYRKFKEGSLWYDQTTQQFYKRD